MTNSQAQAVVWDFDGTIIDSFRIHSEVVWQVLRRHGFPEPTSADYLRNYHAKMRESIRNLSGASPSVVETMYHEFVQSEEHEYEHPERLYFADALALLRRNHEAGTKQIIISNREHYSDQRLGSPRNLAARPPLAGLIDAVVLGDDNHFHKPDPRLLDDAERQLGLKRSDLLVVGDQFVDAELALNLGARAVLVERNRAKIPHLDRLPEGWEKQVALVKSLDEVTISKA